MRALLTGPAEADVREAGGGGPAAQVTMIPPALRSADASSRAGAELSERLDSWASPPPPSLSPSPSSADPPWCRETAPPESDAGGDRPCGGGGGGGGGSQVGGSGDGAGGGAGGGERTQYSQPKHASRPQWMDWCCSSHQGAQVGSSQAKLQPRQRASWQWAAALSAEHHGSHMTAAAAAPPPPPPAPAPPSLAPGVPGAPTSRRAAYFLSRSHVTQKPQSAQRWSGQCDDIDTASHQAAHVAIGGGGGGAAECAAPGPTSVLCGAFATGSCDGATRPTGAAYAAAANIAESVSSGGGLGDGNHCSCSAPAGCGRSRATITYYETFR
jgi:hypothetical protein